MRIFHSFMIIVCATILLLLPVTAGIYNYRTDERTDTFTVATEVATTNATVQLFSPIYENDTSTITLTSYATTDAPLYSSYNTTSRALVIIGLADNTTRSLDVSYDIDAITGSGLDTLLDYLPYIWILIWVAFPLTGLIAIWRKRE